MRVSPGTRLGPYEIVAAIGAGGMGEVYRATDTRLDRSVAIKVLPDGFADNAKVKQRFEREAKMISQLNHPHICTLYDVGSENGVEYLVMELLEGDTLGDRLTKGPLPIGDVLRYGMQIAGALDRAHRAGIIHRDLKPGNIMITRSGAKLLDFGLAKNAVEHSPEAVTEHKPLTQEGTILGTFQYMAPEQLEGLEADARTDIFAFGAVLYEMATGRHAFEGKSKTSLVAAILTEEPPAIAAVQPMTPAAFDRLVHTCLAKEPDDRFSAAHDVLIELGWIQQEMQAAPDAARQHPRSPRSALWLLGIVAAASVASAVAVYLHFHNEPKRVVQTAINFLSSRGRINFDQGPIALSPDGKRIALVATADDGKTLIWVRPLDGSAAQPLSSTEGASYPFWSADSRFIGFFAEGKLKKIDPNSGSAEVIADAPTGRGGTWNREGVILFVPEISDSVMRVSALGGPVTPATRLDATRGEFSHRWPWFLPDGRHFLYLAQRGVAERNGNPQTRIYLSLLDANEPPKYVVEANSNAAYVSPGYLLYVHDTSLRAQKFDSATGTLSGEPVPIVEQIQYNSPAASAIFSVADDGLLAFVGGPGAMKSQLEWVDRSGKILGTVGKDADYWDPRISNDGKRVVVAVNDARVRGDIWIYDVTRPVETRFTFDPADDVAPVWMRDDSRIVFTSYRGSANIFQKLIAGGNDQLLVGSPVRKIMSDCSPDGKTILYNLQSPKTRWDVIAYSLADGKAIPFADTEFNEFGAQFSPDGHWIAYVSNESGKDEVYVTRFPRGGGKWQVSTGGIMPRWAHSGKELFYFTGQSHTFMVVKIQVGDRIEIGLPQTLFTAQLRSLAGLTRTEYDIAPDDQRLLINVASEEQAQSSITLYQNWIAKMAK